MRHWVGVSACLFPAVLGTSLADLSGISEDKVFDRYSSWQEELLATFADIEDFESTTYLHKDYVRVEKFEHHVEHVTRNSNARLSGAKIGAFGNFVNSYMKYDEEGNVRGVFLNYNGPVAKSIFSFVKISKEKAMIMNIGGTF